MNAIDIIRQWCSDNGYSFTYGNPFHVNVWMGETDFASSTDGVCVYAYLLTASEYDGNRDSYNVGIYFATLTDFDFDNTTIDTVTESLKERVKTLLNDLSNGNAVGWSGARFEYGYDDYAENVCWCCLRVTLTALAAECVEMPFVPNYLYLEAKAAGSTVRMESYIQTAPNIEYSTDGETFQAWGYTTVGGTHTFDTLTLANVGDKVYFRGVNDALATTSGNTSYFVMTGRIKAGGNVQTIVDGIGKTKTAINMWGLFSDCTALDEVENGLLPATTLSKCCYCELFFHTSITQSPLLPASVLDVESYVSMFAYCSSLEIVTCLATDISANSCTTGWLTDVGANGTFYKHPDMNDWSEGASGIPSGWTIEDYNG